MKYLCSIVYLLLITGCVSQHYQVTNVKYTPKEDVEIKVNALEGKYNGYAILLKNVSNHNIRVNWDAIQMTIKEGFEVPVVVDAVKPINLIHPGSKVIYHVEPSYAYLNKTDRKLSRIVFALEYSDVFRGWSDTSNSRKIYIPYEVKFEESEMSKSLLVEVKQNLVEEIKPAPQFGIWSNNLYRPKAMFIDKGLTLKYGYGQNNQRLYRDISTTLSNFAIGYRYKFIEPVLSYEIYDTGKDREYRQESNQIGLKTYFHALNIMQFIEFSLFFEFARMNSYNKYGKSGFNWDQVNHFIGIGTSLSLKLPINFMFCIDYNYSFEVNRTIDINDLKDVNRIGFKQESEYLSNLIFGLKKIF